MGVRYYLSGCAHTKTFHNTLGNLLSYDINKTDNIVFIAGENPLIKIMHFRPRNGF